MGLHHCRIGSQVFSRGIDFPIGKLLEENPSARSKHGDQLPKSHIPLRNVSEHKAGAYKIEGSLGERVRDDIVLSNFEVGETKLLQKASINVGDQNMASGRNALAKPLSDGAAALAHFQVIPDWDQLRDHPGDGGIGIENLREGGDTG